MKDDLEDLAKVWQRKDGSSEEVARALVAAWRDLMLRRALVLTLFVASEAALIVLLLLGYEGSRGALTYAFLLAGAVLLPFWILPLGRQLLPSPVPSQDSLVAEELAAQQAVVRALGLPVPQLVLSAYAALASFVWCARGVFGASPLPLVIAGIAFWALLLAGAWWVSWTMLQGACHAVEVLGTATVRPDAASSPRRSRTTFLVGLALAVLLVVIAGAWPLSYIRASREWTDHLQARDRGRSATAEIYAHQIARMDARFAADIAARAAGSEEARGELLRRVRATLATPGARYLDALRKARAATAAPGLDVEGERVTWILAAHGVLTAERSGPGELESLLRSAAVESPCLQLPAAKRLQRLAGPATSEGAPADLDCLITSLADPRSPLEWTEAP